MYARPAVLLGCVLLLAGCGGGAAERRAAWAKWARGADAICRSTQARIVARGGARGYPEIRRLAAAAHADVHAAVGRLSRLPGPDGGDRRATRMLAAARGIDAALGRVLATSRQDWMPNELRAAEALRRSGLELTYAARLAGLRACGRDGLADEAADALAAPAVASLAANFQVILKRRLRRALAGAGASPEAARRAFARAARTAIRIGGGDAGYAFQHAPAAAGAQALRYLNDMEPLAAALRAASRALADGPVGPAEGRRLLHAISSAGGRVLLDSSRLVDRLLKIAHAPPAPAGSGDDPVAPAGGDASATS